MSDIKPTLQTWLEVFIFFLILLLSQSLLRRHAKFEAASKLTILTSEEHFSLDYRTHGPL